MFVLLYTSSFLYILRAVAVYLMLAVIFSNLWRIASEEKRELERLEKPIYNSVRQAAEVHRQVAL